MQSLKSLCLPLLLGGCIAALCSASTIHAATPQPIADTLRQLEQAAWKNTAEDFTFVILGDKTSGGEGKWPIYDAAISEINRLNPEFVITVGDMINGHMQDRERWEAEWREYWDHAHALNAPLLFTVGNHDVANLPCYRYWREDFGKHYYAFDYKKAHFLILNTEEERIDGRGPVWEKMLRFAERDLAHHTTAAHTFLFFHKPMWDDPRFLEDWARLETALGNRPFTVVAGHEHYLSTATKNGNRYVIQNATGAGIDLSPVKKMGCFHGYGIVRMQGENPDYTIKEVGGGAFPVDIAPAAFRDAITFELVQLEGHGPQQKENHFQIPVTIQLHNTLDKPIQLKLRFTPMQRSGWKMTEGDFNQETPDTLTHQISLDKDERRNIPVRFTAATDCLPYPPMIQWAVSYDGQWLNKETLRMEEFDAVPLYPRAAMRAIPEWRLVGPFPLGQIDTAFLPDHPQKANPNFFKTFGPEEGYRSGQIYQGGKTWFPAKNQGWGLLNFNALMGTLDYALGYAACAIYSPCPQQTHAAFYADNFAQLVLNGQLIETAQEFGRTGGFVYAPLNLNQGWNHLVLKEINNHGDWFLRCLLADPQNNLRITPEPE